VNLYGRYFKLVRAIEFSEEHQFWWWPNRFHEPPVVTSGRYEQVVGGLTQGVLRLCSGLLGFLTLHSG
jgi:hypothetical protein